MSFVSAIIVAGGKGQRMKASVPKQFLSIDGKPVLYLTLYAFNLADEIDEIIVVLPENYISWFQSDILDKEKWSKKIILVNGDKERQGSVKNGLDKISPESEIVLVHDGVRPFVRNKDISNLICECLDSDGVIPCISISETVKKVDTDGFVLQTISRENLFLSQTPQAFKTKILKEAHEKGTKLGIEVSDDAMLLEELGYKVKMIEGSRANIKITIPEDLDFALKLYKSGISVQLKKN
ncbi:MAG: 2-C-methyl-D-erythritol 4-phosphate cytidylyltransferase [Deltaproteobacteria bacterium]|nr:MAG: 2-C-methyl-D-erythritol 4-phosphate cytidylyltransferase [Deltaproteobacteria bacterium]